MVNRLSGNTRLLASDASAVVMVVRIEYKKNKKQTMIRWESWRGKKSKGRSVGVEKEWGEEGEVEREKRKKKE